MRILALDLASQTGAAFGRPGERPTLISRRFTREGEAGSMDAYADVVDRAGEWLTDLTRIEKFDRAVIEAPIPEQALSGQTNAWSTMLKFELLGVVKFVLRRRSIEIRFGNIQSVRKFVIGRGNVKSEIAKASVMQVCCALGWNPKNKDEGDAAALWLWACNQVAPRETPHLDPISLGIEPFDFNVKPRRERAQGRVAA